MTSNMTPEQKALREAVARALCWADGADPNELDSTGFPQWMSYEDPADAAIAVALERAAQVAGANAIEAWDFGADETRGLMRLQAADIAAAIRALIPAFSVGE